MLATGVSLASGLAGCTNNGDGGDGGGGGGGSDGGDGGSGNQPTPSVEQVTVSSEDYSPGRAYNTLNLQYATQTVSALRSPDGAAREPDAGTNTSSFTES